MRLRGQVYSLQFECVEIPSTRGDAARVFDAPFHEASGGILESHFEDRHLPFLV